MPKGRWTHLLSGEIVEGGTWRKEYYDYMSLPLFVRPNTILPIGSNKMRPDYDYEEDVTFRFYQLEDGRQVSAVIHNKEGEVVGSLTAFRSGREINVQTDLKDKQYYINLVGYSSIQSISSGTWSQDSVGGKVIPEKSVTNFTITL